MHALCLSREGRPPGSNLDAVDSDLTRTACPAGIDEGLGFSNDYLCLAACLFQHIAELHRTAGSAWIQKDDLAVPQERSALLRHEAMTVCRNGYHQHVSFPNRCLDIGCDYLNWCEALHLPLTRVPRAAGPWSIIRRRVRDFVAQRWLRAVLRIPLHRGPHVRGEAVDERRGPRHVRGLRGEGVAGAVRAGDPLQGHRVPQHRLRRASGAAPRARAIRRPRPRAPSESTAGRAARRGEGAGQGASGSKKTVGLDKV